MTHNAHYSTKFTNNELQKVCFNIANYLQIRGIIYCHVDDFDNRRQWRQAIIKFVQDNGIGRAMLVSRDMAYLFKTKEDKKEFCSGFYSVPFVRFSKKGEKIVFKHSDTFLQIAEINRESFLDRYLSIWSD